jgi:hypothetical protein
MGYVRTVKCCLVVCTRVEHTEASDDDRAMDDVKAR